MKTIFNIDLLKFEFKKLLTDFLFWAMLLSSIFFIICNITALFKLPVSSNEQAFHFLTNTDVKGNYNIYHIKISDIFDKYDNILMSKKSQRLWDITNYDDLTVIDRKFSNMRNDINHKIKNDIGNVRFSKIFFKIASVILVEYSKLSLMIFFPIVWYRDKLYKTSSLVKATPTKISQYLFCKFMTGFITYIIFLFVVLLVVAIVAKLRLTRLSFKFNMSDMIIPFISFTIPSMLFFTILLSSLSLLLKKALLSSALFCLIMFTNIFPRNLRLLSIDAITGYSENWIYIPPTNIYYGLKYQILFIICSVCMFFLSCKVCNNIHRGDD